MQNFTLVGWKRLVPLDGDRYSYVSLQELARDPTAVAARHGANPNTLYRYRKRKQANRK